MGSLRAHIAIVLIVGGTLLAGSLPDTPQIFWPFVTYSMFAKMNVNDGSVVYKIFGETDAHPYSEIVLNDDRYFHPFLASTLIMGLNQLGSTDPTGEKAKSVLQKVKRQYLKLRKSKRHNGPEIRSLALYRLTCVDFVCDENPKNRTRLADSE